MTDLSHKQPTSGPQSNKDPRVTAAQRAEKRVYEVYGLDITDHFIDVSALDRQIRVVETGTNNGSPVVLIPGGIGFGIVWVPFLPELTKHRLLVMDRPGGGFSDGIDHRMLPLETIATSSTAALFDHFDLTEAPILGNSMGGLWALRFAISYPNRVSAIVLLGTPALYPETSAPLSMRLMSLPWIGDILVHRLSLPNNVADVQQMWEFLGHPNETARLLPHEFHEAMYRMATLPTAHQSWSSLIQRALRLRGPNPNAAFTPANLRQIRPPVLVLWGQNDPFGTVEQGRRGTEYLPDGEFHEVGIGHHPWLNEPIQCGELIRHFID